MGEEELNMCVETWQNAVWLCHAQLLWLAARGWELGLCVVLIDPGGCQYKEKSTGLRIEPCCTPQVKGALGGEG